MKKLRKISLHQLDGAELEKRQEGLLFGGGSPGFCKCGSCASGNGLPGNGTPSSSNNLDMNKQSGYTVTGNNNPTCTCIGEAAGLSIQSTPPK